MQRKELTIQQYNDSYTQAAVGLQIVLTHWWYLDTKLLPLFFHPLATSGNKWYEIFRSLKIYFWSCPSKINITTINNAMVWARGTLHILLCPLTLRYTKNLTSPISTVYFHPNPSHRDSMGFIKCVKSYISCHGSDHECILMLSRLGRAPTRTYAPPGNATKFSAHCLQPGPSPSARTRTRWYIICTLHNWQICTDFDSGCIPLFRLRQAKKAESGSRKQYCRGAILTHRVCVLCDGICLLYAEGYEGLRMQPQRYFFGAKENHFYPCHARWTNIQA